MAGTPIPGLRSMRFVRIHCPIALETLEELLEGRLDAIERDPVAAAMLAILRDIEPPGAFVPYRGVVQIGFGAETFVPMAGALPSLGAVGAVSHSPTVVLTSFFDLPENALSALLARILAAHPWEVPVVEVGETSLATR